LAGQLWWRALAYVVSVPLPCQFDGVLILVWVGAIWTIIGWKTHQAGDGAAAGPAPPSPGANSGSR
jgi:hypothetical protein